MVFLTPLGLLALLSVVPLLIAYLVRSEPARVQLPTMDFLTAGEDGGRDRSALDRLRRNLLLLAQLLVLVAVALALASPFVITTGTAEVEESVVVLDTSASMTVSDADGPRFERATALAREAVTGTTSVITSGSSARVPLQRGGEADALSALSEARVTDSEGDLAGAVSRAVAVGDRSARIVVVSDFAGDQSWRAAVETARARGYTVELRPVGGAVDNVGIVGAEYERTTVTVSVKSYADSEVTRTLSLGDQEESVTLAPGDVGTATFPVPPGNSELVLQPGDAFPVDDRLPVAGPDSSQVRVLVLTNGESRYVRTALSVLPAVDLTVREPPTTIDREYDVVVFSAIDRSRLLESTRQRAQELVRDGGGAVVTAQDDVAEIPYGPLNPVSVTGEERNPSIRVGEASIAEGIRFPPPSEYLVGEGKEGSRTIVRADDSPLIARGSLGEGRTFYYGYLASDSTFQFNYQYPVFWKRLLYAAADRETLSQTNLPTGSTLSVANGTTVQRPGEESAVAMGSVRLSRAGFYEVGDSRYGVSLRSDGESNVSAPSLQTGEDSIVKPREETVQRPLDLSPLVAVVAVVGVFGELAILRRRGDL
jgi:hypothetical protein